MIMLGRLYREGKGTEKNLNKAAEYFRKAAQNNELVEVLWNIGTTDSLNELVTLADTEIKKGNAFAAECLSILYLEGKIIAQDEHKALNLLEKAANLGSKSATEKLMLMSLESEDDRRAVIAASVFLDANDAIASEIVSEAYTDGKGLPKDDGMSSYWTSS